LLHTFLNGSPTLAIPSLSWFLGPKAENEYLLTELVTSALRSHADWRRSYHPEDGSPIVAAEKDLPAFRESIAKLKRDFAAMLDELQGSVPFFSGRYNGHMVSEQTIASQAAYFAAMLHNPNNVSLEVSPVTTRFEAEVADQLAAMIGYDPRRSWGHLTSGGTLANFEALWIARNILYHPVAAASAAKELGVSISAWVPDGSTADLRQLGLWELLNLRPGCALDLWDSLWSSAPRDVVSAALQRRSLATLGYQDYSQKLVAEFGDPLPAGVVLAAATGHYSWEKIVRALGIGSNQLVLVPVDKFCRMDPDALWQTIATLTDRKTPIMACISVCGTTEEGAIDRLDQILAVRDRAERELGVTFHVHSDACYGGYAATITRAPDGTALSAHQIRTATESSSWPTEEWVAAMAALQDADSVTIDPHKLGYIPYPAGAFLLKDKRGRDLVATDPPYLSPATHPEGVIAPSIGRFIFEGSKPGAAAAAVWLSHKTISLDITGHGSLIASTTLAARRLHNRLCRVRFAPFHVVRLPEPDLNIVCFFLYHEKIDSLPLVNDLNEAIYAELSPGGEVPPDYMITRTRLTSPAYDGAVAPLLAYLDSDAEKYWAIHPGEGLVVLRATVMNPFSSDTRQNHVEGLVLALRKAADRALQEIRNGAQPAELISQQADLQCEVNVV
jgi:glutamate/tyrosine decarboxylase-like PLP-dependent enzyme